MTTGVRLTLADLADLPEDDGNRYELIDGELHVTAAPKLTHQLIADAICATIRDWKRQTQDGSLVVSTPGVIFADDEAMIPDVVFVRRERLASVIGNDEKLHGPPDLVIEVVSPGKENAARDRVKKKARYAYRGVAEYWIVDHQTRAIEVYRLEGTVYGEALIMRANDELTSPLLPGFSCRVSTFFADLPLVEPNA